MTSRIFNGWSLLFFGLGAAAIAGVATGHELRAVAALALALAIWGYRRLPRTQFVVFSIVAVVLCVASVLSAALAFDVYLHHRFFRSGGYNVWGYRGEPLSRKRPGEVRLAMLGGSLVFGFGVDMDETIPAYLRRELSDRTVVNLGLNGDGAYAFPPTLKDYAYLELDQVMLYSGIVDFVPRKVVFRHQSGMFLATGYLPILPIVPLAKWLRVTDLWDAARVPVDGGDRAATKAANFALQMQAAIGNQLAKIAEVDRQPRRASIDSVCGPRFDFYCGEVSDAVLEARRQGLEVFVVTEPYLLFSEVSSEFHHAQQAALAAMIARRFGGDAQVHYLNMGNAVNVKDPTLCFDGVMHLTAKGNAQLAHQLAAALKTVERRAPR